MTTKSITSAATRGSISVEYVELGAWSYPWRSQVRDNQGEFPITPVVTTNTNNTEAVLVEYTYVSHLDQYTGVCNRYFMAFDTSVVTSEVLSAVLYINVPTSGLANGDLIPVKASAPTITTNLTGANYYSIPGLEAGRAMNNGIFGNVTKYADSGTSGIIANTWNAIQLNDTACFDINNLQQFKIALVNHTFDYLYNNPALDAKLGVGINVTSPYAPYLYVTLRDRRVLSIPTANVIRVNPVLSANIRNINVVDSYVMYRSSTGGVGDNTNPSCSIVLDIALYCVSPLTNINIGDILYNDQAKTSVFDGSSLWWSLAISQNQYGWQANLYQISSTGQIIAILSHACYA